MACHQNQSISHQLDLCMMASSGGETLVARDERSTERFGKGDVERVVGREIGPQIRHARQKEIVGISAQGKVREIGEGRAAAFAVNLPFAT
jgi:hypothetical protein